MIVLLGNTPSSGSSWLADLLDSSPASMCGPELNLFSNERFYDDFSRFKKDPLQTSRCGSVYSPRIHLHVDRLPFYGLTLEGLRGLFQRTASAREFVDSFSKVFAEFRGRGSRPILCEKTPQNLNTLGRFLEEFPDGWFVHLVRNPLYVARSLHRRGFSLFLATATWLVDEAAVAPFLDHPRVRVVSYEELVRRPFQLSAELLTEITGQRVGADAVQRGFEGNEFRRQQAERLRSLSWGVDEYGVVSDANRGEVGDRIRSALQTLLAARVAPEYAARFGLEPWSFKEALRALGYEQELLEALNGVDAAPRRQLWRGRELLARKWLRDLAAGDAVVTDLRGYLRPLEWGA